MSKKTVFSVLLNGLLILSVLAYWFVFRKPTTETMFAFAQITDSHCDNTFKTVNANQSVQWINQQEEIDFVIHTGDLTQNGDKLEEWIQISSIMNQLNGKEWAVLRGNHDSLTYFKDVFGNVNYVVTVENYAFIILSWLSKEITTDQYTWLDEQLELYRDYKVVIASHYLHSNSDEGHNYQPSPSLQPLCSSHLLLYPNVILGISGHNHENDYAQCGNIHFVTSKPVFEGYVRLFYCYSNGSIHIRTRNIPLETYLNGIDNDFWVRS